MSSAIVLATTAENAEALLSGERDRDHRRFPPKKLPARAYLAVVGTGSVVGECELGAAERHTAKGWALPVSKPRRYRKPRPVVRMDERHHHLDRPVEVRRRDVVDAHQLLNQRKLTECRVDGIRRRSLVGVRGRDRHRRAESA